MRASHIKRGKESRKYQSDLDRIQESMRKVNRSNLSAVINDIHALNPSLHDKIVPIIAKVIPITNDNETLLGFGYLLDCLIGMPSIAPFLERQLVNFYCSIFRSLVTQKQYEGVNELKVMRKYWLGRIHPNSYAQMRIMIYEQMRIDIDYVPENLINDIYNHYLHFLRMDPNNIIVHLPQLNWNVNNRSKETSINQNHQTRKQLQQVSRVQKVKVDQIKSGLQFTNENIEQKTVQMKQRSIKIKEDDLNRMNEKRQVFQRMAETQKSQENKINNMKRIRNDSEQTTFSIKLTKKWRGEDTTIQIPLNKSRKDNQPTLSDQPKQSKNYEVPKKKYKNDPISGFSVLFCEQCHICGLKILSKRLLNEHLSRHKGYENPDPPINLQNSVVITFDNFMKYPDCCSHCNKGFSPQFYDGNWIFRNCMIRIIYEIQYVMHPQCSLLVTGQEVYPQVYIEGSNIQEEKLQESKDETQLKDEKDTSMEKSTLSELPCQFQQHLEMISVDL